jgi:hypothetical protein
MISEPIFATVGPLLRGTELAGGGPIWPLFVAIAFPLGTIFGLWLAHRDSGVPDDGDGGGGPGRRPWDRPRPIDPDGSGEDPPPAWIEEVERYLAREAEEHRNRRG